MIGIQLGKIVLGDVKIIPKVTKSIVVKAIAAVVGLIIFVVYRKVKKSQEV